MSPMAHALTHAVLAMHGIEGQVLERELLADLEARQVQQKVRPLSRRQKHLPYRAGSIQKAPVRGHQPVGQELAVADFLEGEPVEAGVGAIKQPYRALQ